MALCDRLGFLVIDETFDEWRRGWDFEGKLLVVLQRGICRRRWVGASSYARTLWEVCAHRPVLGNDESVDGRGSARNRGPLKRRVLQPLLTE
jgi:hypothetical protein